MGVFLVLLFLLLLLLVLIVIGSIQNFSLWCVSKHKHEFIHMIIPALISSVAFILSFLLTYFILKLFNIDTLDLIFSMIMKFEYSFNNYIIMLISYLLSTALFITLQAFCIKLSDIDYSKIYSLITKIAKTKKEDTKVLESSNNIPVSDLPNKAENSNLPITLEEKEKLSFFYLFSASLFTFAICFFTSLALFYIGTLIGQSYII